MTAMWRHMTGAERILEVLLTRRSVSPRRLQSPGPNPDELDAIIQAGLRAPDHGGLHPWRVIEFRPQNREALAWCFEQEKLRRDPLASPTDLRRAREHAPAAAAGLRGVAARAQQDSRARAVAGRRRGAR